MNSPFSHFLRAAVPNWELFRPIKDKDNDTGVSLNKLTLLVKNQGNNQTFGLLSDIASLSTAENIHGCILYREFYKQHRSLSFPCFQHHCWYLLIKKITRVVEKDLKCFANTHYSMAIFFRALLTAAKQFCPWRGLIIQLKFYMVTQMILLAFQKLNNHLVMSPNFLNNNYQNNIT